jgi:hypothetical protein
MTHLILNNEYNSLADDFKPIVYDIMVCLIVKGWRPIPASGRRTVAEQHLAKKNKASQTMQSKHLTGYACDITDKRYYWNISRVHQFWLDLAECALKQAPKPGIIRLGMLWGDGDEPDTEKEITRLDTYRKTLKLLQANKITVDEAEKKIDWFCDVAHVEMIV